MKNKHNANELHLSVVLAIHNEEQNLDRCLSSVQSIADEIVIVDGGSTDNSVEIAQKFQAKITKTTNKMNFHINKQMAIDRAQGQLILQLDADEVLDSELIQYIAKLKLNLNLISADTEDQPVAWYLKRKNLFLGRFLRKGGQYPDPVIRLFLKGRAYLPQKNVHEQMQVDGKLGEADGHLLHYSNPDLASYLRKARTYTEFAAHDLKKNHYQLNLASFFQYFLVKPVVTFTSIFIRHKGFYDGWQGFLFALFSAAHHPVTLVKFLRLKTSDD
jgi:glycosyltransferase involved in cell wall biosynthesis